MNTCTCCNRTLFDCSCDSTSEMLDSLYEHDFHAYYAQIAQLGKIEMETE